MLDLNVTATMKRRMKSLLFSIHIILLSCFLFFLFFPGYSLSLSLKLVEVEELRGELPVPVISEGSIFNK